MGSMAARDTGSAWFDGYVGQINQQIAAQNALEAYGAAGPSGSAGATAGIPMPAAAA
jgi:hypothetical protein